jgi:hypothetical protein
MYINIYIFIYNRRWSRGTNCRSSCAKEHYTIIPITNTIITTQYLQAITTTTTSTTSGDGGFRV